MKKHNTILASLGLVLILLIGLSSCEREEDDSGGEETAEVNSSESGAEEHGNESSGDGEHSGEGTGSEESDEESATQYGKTDTYDETRNGARLILNYDSVAQAFTGTVINTTDETLTQVRVEVHLSNGTELGPTDPSDLDAGASIEVTLAAVDEEFDTWGAHPEVGEASGGEHGSEENHD